MKIYFCVVFYLLSWLMHIVLLCLSIYIIFTLSSVFNMCGQMSMMNIELSMNWCDFIFTLCISLSVSKYLHQTTDVCMYKHCTKTIFSSLSKLFSIITFHSFSVYFLLEVFTIFIIILNWLYHCICFWVWQMQWNDRNFLFLFSFSDST